jgi:outer membrane cobalamin receptor
VPRSSILSLTAISALITFSSPAQAYINPDSVYQMPGVTIIGKPIVDENFIERSSTEVTRVTEQQLKDLNAVDLPSALRRIPGVMISRHNLIGNYGGGEGGAVYIRGMGSSRPGASILTLVDGVPKFVGLWTHPLMDVLSVDHLESVDIYKSPRPVLWGNMSFGAISITSRRMRQEGSRTDLTTMYGPNETYNAVFNHGGKTGAFDYYFGAAAKGTDGHRVQADGSLRNYWGRMGYQLTDTWDASLIFSGSNNWADDPGPQGGPVPPRSRYKIQDLGFNLTLADRTDRVNGYFRLYLDDGALRWRQWDTARREGFDTNTDYLNRGIRLRQNILLDSATELTVGADYDTYGGKSAELHTTSSLDKSMPGTYFTSTAVYTSLSRTFNLTHGISLTPSAGVRLNHHSVFQHQAGPEAGVTLAGEKWQVYSNFARAYNYMGVYAVWFYNYTWNYKNEAFRDIRPERVKHYETGLKYTPLEGLVLDFSVFHDRGEDMIAFVPPPPPPPSFANVGRFRNTGFETSVSWTPVRGFSFYCGLTLMNPTPVDLPQAPEHMLTLGSNLLLRRNLQLSLDLESVGTRYVANDRFGAFFGKLSPYTVANAKLAYFLNDLKPSLGASSLFFAVENFTDTSYEYKPGYPMPGATFYAGLSYQR